MPDADIVMGLLFALMNAGSLVLAVLFGLHMRCRCGCHRRGPGWETRDDRETLPRHVPGWFSLRGLLGTRGAK